MKKVIALSTVLVFGALGMACDGGTADNKNTNTNKPATNATTAPTVAPPVTNTNTNSTTAPSNANVKPMTNANANTKDK